MSATRVFVARLNGSPVFDPAGDRVGKVRDVLVVYRKSEAPRVVGLIVEIPGRKRVFMSIGKVTAIEGGQVITTGLVNMRRFEQRGGEVLVIAEMLGRQVDFNDGSGRATIEDVAIEEEDDGDWEVTQLFVRRQKSGGSPFGRGQTSYVTWREVSEASKPGEGQSAEQLIATYSELKPADLANTLLELPEQRRQDVVEELPDERLADVLEEMPEHEQIEILQKLDDDRAADVLDHMQPDDAADLIAQLPEDRGEHLLELMEPDEADDVRFLLSYGPDTAGGLMTNEPVILSPDATVAEGLAHIRKHDLPPALGAAVCVALPPLEAPTGRFLGVVHFQRMLRYPPQERLGALIDQGLEPVRADTSAAEVSRILASYDLVSVPVVDEANRLVGVVTIDDVLDYLLPDDWRSHPEGNDEHRRRAQARASLSTGSIPIAGRRTTDGTR
ncbi:magnesium transporter MgtE N-terminal domain-containing protein [Agromyces seonyuensis]|uniref:CBS domain-containing protein n=1 Tax=Agromyces seonyuensis TaxID=2662446 RepID=A0A6I4P3T1_9MICO|nr:CBS domain-containing protein [Agromyces seonyuensis]